MLCHFLRQLGLPVEVMFAAADRGQLLTRMRYGIVEFARVRRETSLVTSAVDDVNRNRHPREAIGSVSV
ncbi:hypothetical protein NJ76_31365 [Rhodococcus sp. IITR03]|nr:hypothetical protein NJ76_31365 [Rhodococcus sp. IITR03]